MEDEVQGKVVWKVFLVIADGNYGKEAESMALVDGVEVGSFQKENDIVLITMVVNKKEDVHVPHSRETDDYQITSINEK